MTTHAPGPTRRMRIKRFLRRVVAAACHYSGSSWVWYSLVAKRGIRVLAYHGVETPPSGPLSVSVENFTRQMEYLREHYNVIKLDELERYLNSDEPPSRELVVLTFDDGYKNFRENAFPVLNKLNLPATCFVIASKLNGQDGRFMDWKDLLEPLNSGLISVGSHSLTHKSIARIDHDARDQEVRASRELLRDHLSHEIEFFCYPYGTFRDFDSESIVALRDSGYRMACTSVNGVNFKRTDPFRLRRTKIEWGDDLVTYSRILKGGLDAWFLVDYFLRALQRPRTLIPSV